MSAHRRHTLWSLTRGQRRRYALAILTMGLAVGFTFVSPHLVGRALDGVIGASPPPLPEGLRAWGGPFGALVPYQWLGAAVLGGLLATAVAGALRYVARRNAALASEAISRDLRQELYGRLERLPCGFHDRSETGDLIQRCTSDVETVRVFLAAQVAEIGHSALLFLIALPALLVLDVPMTLVSVALFPLILFFAYRFFHRIQEVFREQDEAEGRMTTVLQENLTGIRVVRAFARQAHERERFGERNAAFRDTTRRVISLLGSYWSTSDVLCLLQTGVVLLVGAAWTHAGRLTIGELNTFLMIEALVIWPLRQLGRILNESGRSIVALGRIGEVLGRPVEAQGHELSRVRGEIVFEDVTFAYGHFADGPGEEPRDDGETPIYTPALENVSFRVGPGEVLALVGPPGSGKSTIVQLLLKLYRPQRGAIRLDGRDLAELDPRALRGVVGTVLQEPFLYSKTVRQNLLVGRSAAREEELVHAATAACIHASIEGFDEGYDTMVGERGVTLSGGQRQRVAIARALLKDPPILVLDDALSAVDTRTESEILTALEARRGHRTTLLVTHRLASVTHADRICVLSEGRIVQTGTHAELVRTEGAYRRLWRVQNALEDELDADLHAVRATNAARDERPGSPSPTAVEERP